MHSGAKVNKEEIGLTPSESLCGQEELLKSNIQKHDLRKQHINPASYIQLV